MSNNMTRITEARQTVEQLKMEINVDRIKVSVAVSELITFCQSVALLDPLISPVSFPENPFREKRLVCSLL
ncbi:hypothetical protein FKM82_015717 [Ascaphus truei]|uniref:guanine nucleotide-binding protein G(I)/G(S)/G(O) subunit gamma-8 n=1 Tax=Ascaphus truei TaxID=8439 RepID=UPI003F59160C